MRGRRAVPLGETSSGCLLPEEQLLHLEVGNERPSFVERHVGRFYEAPDEVVGRRIRDCEACPQLGRGGQGVTGGRNA